MILIMKLSVLIIVGIMVVIGVFMVMQLVMVLGRVLVLVVVIIQLKFVMGDIISIDQLGINFFFGKKIVCNVRGVIMKVDWIWFVVVLVFLLDVCVDLSIWMFFGFVVDLVVNEYLEGVFY